MSCKYFVSVPETHDTFVTFSRGTVALLEVCRVSQQPIDAENGTLSSAKPNNPRPKHVEETLKNQRRPAADAAALVSQQHQPYVTTSYVPPPHPLFTNAVDAVMWGDRPSSSAPLPSGAENSRPPTAVVQQSTTQQLHRLASIDSVLQFPKSPQLQPLIADHHQRLVSHEDMLEDSLIDLVQDDDYDDRTTSDPQPGESPSSRSNSGASASQRSKMLLAAPLVTDGGGHLATHRSRHHHTSPQRRHHYDFDSAPIQRSPPPSPQGPQRTPSPHHSHPHPHRVPNAHSQPHRSTSVHLPVVVRSVVHLPQPHAATCFCSSVPVVLDPSNASSTKRHRNPAAIRSDHGDRDIFVAIGTRSGTVLLIRSGWGHHGSPEKGCVVAHCRPPHLPDDSGPQSPAEDRSDSCTTAVWIRGQPIIAVGYRSGVIAWFLVHGESCSRGGVARAVDGRRTAAAQHSESSFNGGGGKVFSMKHLCSYPSFTTNTLGAVVSAEESVAGGVVVFATDTDTLLFAVPAHPSVCDLSSAMMQQRPSPSSSPFLLDNPFGTFRSAGGSSTPTMSPTSATATFCATGSSSIDMLTQSPTTPFACCVSASTCARQRQTFQQLRRSARSRASRWMTDGTYDTFYTSHGAEATRQTIQQMRRPMAQMRCVGEYVSCHPFLPFFAMLSRSYASSSLSSFVSHKSMMSLYLQVFEIHPGGSSVPEHTTTTLLYPSMVAIPRTPPRLLRADVRPDINLDAAWRYSNDLVLMVSVADETSLRLFHFVDPTAATSPTSTSEATMPPTHAHETFLMDAYGGDALHSPLHPPQPTRRTTGGPTAPPLVEGGSFPPPAAPPYLQCRERLVPFTCHAAGPTSFDAAAAQGQTRGYAAVGSLPEATSHGTPVLIANVEWMSAAASRFNKHHADVQRRQRGELFAPGCGIATHVVGVGLRGELSVTTIVEGSSVSFCGDSHAVVAEGSTVCMLPESAMDDHTLHHTPVGRPAEGGGQDGVAAYAAGLQKAAIAKAAVCCQSGDGLLSGIRVGCIMNARALAGFTIDSATSLQAVTVLRSQSIFPPLAHGNGVATLSMLEVLLRYLKALESVNVCDPASPAPGLLRWLVYPSDITPGIPLMVQGGVLEPYHLTEGSEDVCRCPSSIASARSVSSLRTSPKIGGAQVIIASPKQPSDAAPNDPRRLLLLDVLDWIPKPPPSHATNDHGASPAPVVFAAAKKTSLVHGFRFDQQRLCPWLAEKLAVERLSAQLLFFHRSVEAAAVLSVHHAVDAVFAPLAALLLTVVPAPTNAHNGQPQQVAAASSRSSSSVGDGIVDADERIQQAARMVDSLSDCIGPLLTSALLYTLSLPLSSTANITGSDHPDIPLHDRLALTVLAHPSAEEAVSELRSCFLTSQCSILVRLLLEGVDHHTIPAMQRHVDNTSDVQLASCLFSRIGASSLHHVQVGVRFTPTPTGLGGGTLAVGHATATTAAHCWSAWIRAYRQFLVRHRLFVQNNIIELFISKKILKLPPTARGGAPEAMCVCGPAGTPAGRTTFPGSGDAEATTHMAPLYNLINLHATCAPVTPQLTHLNRICSVCQQSAIQPTSTQRMLPSSSKGSVEDMRGDHHHPTGWPSIAGPHVGGEGGGDSVITVDTILTSSYVWCSSCGHGGHVRHLREWFALHVQCAASGCACRCSAPVKSC